MLCITSRAAAALLAVGIGLASSAAHADAPDAPSYLEATAESSEIRLSWSSSSGASSYVVLRDTDSGGYSYREVGTTYSTYYADNDVKPGATYYYVVKAKSDNGTSSASNQAHATMAASAPSNLTASVEDKTVKLSWSTTSDASSYVVLRSTDSGGYSYREVGTTYSSYYTDNDIKSGKTYYYVVRGKASSGSLSPNSNQAQAVVPIRAPHGVSATASSSTEIRLSWDSVSGADSYVVLRDTSSGGYSYSEVGTAYSSYYSDTGVTPGTTYYYVIKAKNSDSTSSPSKQVSATTPK
jgi:fibronectin type 3 domain-containing protein